ncbi:MAG: transglycosylase domain-containing protein [Patescibacteria group bacterium]
MKIFPYRPAHNISARVHAWTLLALWVVAGGGALLFAWIIYLRTTLPDPEAIATRQVKESTKIYDSTGETLLYDIYDEERRTVIGWDQIPQAVKDATVAIEDANFYGHKGFDIRGIVRAFFKILSSGTVSQGGSTITQQLIKKALLSDEKTPSRKIRELMLAIEVERHFTKEEILLMYLNQIPYGSNAYGIESASRTFFGKPAKELALAESALLAALPQAPSYLSPYGSHTEELTGRKDFILQRMRELNFISDEQYGAALDDKLEFTSGRTGLSAPHFVIMVKDYLERKYGSDAVSSGGFKIVTSLDAKLQTKAEELVKKYAEINTVRYKASNAALVAVDPRSGGVIALVGSHDYFDIEHEGNFNVATALRQPGSAFKPFAYAAAFIKGYPDATTLFDVRTEFNPLCSANALQQKDRLGDKCYHPQNYDGLYRGPVSMRQGLAQSLNIPSVKTLYLAGVPDTIALAQKMGITSLNEPARYGLSLVLGGAEVRLVDLVSAYGVFANDGVRNPWFLIQRIERADGTVLEETESSPSRVLDSQIARLVTSVLSDNDARAGVFGYNSPLFFPNHSIAAKTGTTQENRDAWVVGYSPSVAVGVWTGNNDNASMTRAGAGISASGPLWREFIALANASGGMFDEPSPVSSDKTMLNGQFRDAAGQIHSILWYVDRRNPLGPLPANPSRDFQFENWESAARTWVSPGAL